MLAGGSVLPVIGGAAGVVAALLFVAAGIDKLRHRGLLRGVIANYRLLPDALVGPAAALLPPAELAVAALLLLGLAGALPAMLAPAGPAAAALLLLLFASAMAINIGRGRRHIDCGCGHAGLKQRLGWGQVLRNVALSAALLPLITGGAPPLAGADIAVAAAAGTVIYLLLMLFTTLSAVAGQSPGRARG